MDERLILRTIAAGRVALGLTALLAPRRLGNTMFGSAGEHPVVRLTTRMLGARDLALGAAQLVTLDNGGRAARSVALLGAGADAIDDAVTAAAFTRLPRRGAIVAFVSASGAAIAGYRAAARLRM